MKDVFDRSALGLAAAGTALALIAGAGGWATALALLSLIPAALMLAQRPTRAFYLAGFLGLGLFVVLLEWPFPPQIQGSWIPLVVLGLQARLYFLRNGEERHRRNREFAQELRAALPGHCTIFVDTDIESQSTSQALQPEHIVRAQPGEALAADGVVSFGSGFVDELLITGNPEPAARGPGKFVFAGSKSKNSGFLYRVVQSGKNTFLLRKADFLESPFGEFPLLNGRYFLLELTTFSALLVLHVALEQSAGVLLGLWLASSGALFAGAKWNLRLAFLARSAASGVLWASPRGAHEVAEARTLVTDPEGSVLEGTLRISGIATDEELGEDGALRLAAPLARRIESPAAFCLLREIRIRNIPLEQLNAYFVAPGGGYGIVSDSDVRLCDEPTAVQEGIPFAKFQSFLVQESQQAGSSIHFLMKDGVVVAAFSLVDSVRASSAEAISQIQRSGRQIVFLSPAGEASLGALAESVGVQHFRAGAVHDTALELLLKLKREKMSPLWLDNGITPLPKGNFPALAGPARTGGRGSSALTDIASHWQAIRLAGALRYHSGQLFFRALACQLIFGGLCIAWPMAGALLGTALTFAILLGPASAAASDPLPN